jgi:predicted Zn-dependent protease with MMP-like domain
VADDSPQQPPSPLEGPGLRASQEELDELWGLIENGDLDDAIALGDELAETWPRDASIAIARAAAFYECGLLRESLEEARRAGELDTDEPQMASWYEAAAHHYLWDFGAARAKADELLRDHPDFGEGWYLLAQICEMQEDEVGARRGYERALQLEPQRFFRPTRFSLEQMDEALSQAREGLDAEFLEALEKIAVVVEALPRREYMLQSPGDDDPLPPDVLGLFVGNSRLDLSVFDSTEEPGIIFLFQKNLERASASEEELVSEIHTTLYHELAHYLGFEEEDMAELDLE